MNRLLPAIVLSCTVAILAGCATSATQQAMTITAAEMPAGTSAALKGALGVRNVIGGKETNPMWTSQVDNAGFKSALEQSLAISGYKAAPGTAPAYVIDADLKQLDQPLFGLTFNVRSSVVYTVEGKGVKKEIPVEATGTATPSDAFVGVERLRLASERSIKENIKKLLALLADAVR